MVPDPKKGPQENPAGLESVYKYLMVPDPQLFDRCEKLRYSSIN